MTTHQFQFEQLTIPLYGEGALFYGEATLESACEGDDEFYVSSIQLGNKTVLSRPSRINSADPVGAFLFTEIVKQIENDKTVVGGQAAQEWAALVEDQSFEARRVHRIPEISPHGFIHSVAAE